MTAKEDTQGTICMTVCLTPDQHRRLLAIDEEWVGSDHYMGLAYFWAYEYRFLLRDATADERVRVHRAFRSAHLELDGESLLHILLLEDVFGPQEELRIRWAAGKS